MPGASWKLPSASWQLPSSRIWERLGLVIGPGPRLRLGLGLVIGPGLRLRLLIGPGPRLRLGLGLVIGPGLRLRLLIGPGPRLRIRHQLMLGLLLGMCRRFLAGMDTSAIVATARISILQVPPRGAIAMITTVRRRRLRSARFFQIM